MNGPVVAVDLGVSSVAAAVDVAPDAAVGPEPVDVPGAREVVEPAAVFAPADGSALCTGSGARRRAVADPSRYEPTPRLRIDEGELLLGTRIVGVAEACGAVIADALHRAGPLLRARRPRALVLTHPADWDSGRLEVLRSAGSGLADTLRLIPEPIAAAAHALWMRPRAAHLRGPIAVLDLGAAVATASVLEAARDGAHGAVLLAHRHRSGVGGDDADELLCEHLLAGLDDDDGAARVREVAAGATLADRRHRRVLLDDVRAARERLSDAAQAPVALPGRVVAAWLARAELEDVLRPALRGVVALLADTLVAAGTPPERLAGVWLTGGAARTPLLGALVHRELGVPATVAADPRTVVARGALVLARERDAAAPPASCLPPAPRLPPAPLPAPSVPSRPARLTPPAPVRELGHPPDPDEDDTGDVLDDAWDGGWDRDARWPDRWESHPEPRWDARGPVEHRPAVTPAPSADAGDRARRRRRLATGGAVVALVVALVGLLVAVVRDEQPAAAAGQELAVWGQRFLVPEGWVRSGGDESARRVVLRPADDPQGIALIAVQFAALPADLAGDPERVRAQIVEQYDQARAAGDPVSDIRLRTTVGGRDATRYRQQVAPGVSLDWVVVRSGDDQVSVGCRRPDDGSGGSDHPVGPECETVVTSLERARG